MITQTANPYRTQPIRPYVSQRHKNYRSTLAVANHFLQNARKKFQKRGDRFCAYVDIKTLYVLNLRTAFLQKWQITLMVPASKNCVTPSYAAWRKVIIRYPKKKRHHVFRPSGCCFRAHSTSPDTDVPAGQLDYTRRAWWSRRDYSFLLELLHT